MKVRIEGESREGIPLAVEWHGAFSFHILTPRPEGEVEIGVFTYFGPANRPPSEETARLLIGQFFAESPSTKEIMGR